MYTFFPYPLPIVSAAHYTFTIILNSKLFVFVGVGGPK
jgi:hypothetical protein